MTVTRMPPPKRNVRKPWQNICRCMYCNADMGYVAGCELGICSNCGPEHRKRYPNDKRRKSRAIDLYAMDLIDADEYAALQHKEFLQ